MATKVFTEKLREKANKCLRLYGLILDGFGSFEDGRAYFGVRGIKNENFGSLDRHRVGQDLKAICEEEGYEIREIVLNGQFA